LTELLLLSAFLLLLLPCTFSPPIIHALEETVFLLFISRKAVLKTYISRYCTRFALFVLRGRTDWDRANLCLHEGNKCQYRYNCCQSFRHRFFFLSESLSSSLLYLHAHSFCAVGYGRVGWDT
jgi:hypothetical protein